MQQKIPMLNLKLEYDYMKKDIDQAIAKCLEHQKWILGPEVKELEEKIAEYIGCKHCVGVSSGTDALLLSLRALAIKKKNKEYWTKDDLIITTPFTFTATADTILRAGATPLFADINLDTYNIDPEKIKQAILAYKGKVVGIIPVHLYGLACFMDEILQIAKENNLFIVEDCAQAFGAKYKDKKVGSFGDLAAFSFFPSKNLGAFGDAGAVTTNDDELAELVRILRVHGGKDKYKVDHIGYKARLDTLQAAILLAKLKYIDEFNQRRRKIASIYSNELKNLKGIITPTEYPQAYHVYHQYTIRVENNKRDTLQKYLKENGIETMIYYPLPLHKMKVFINNGMEVYGSLQNSEVASQTVLSLPIEPLMEVSQLENVTKAIKDFLK